MSLKTSDDKSRLVQVMAWARRTISRYCASVDPGLCPFMTSLGHNFLMT